MRGTKVVRVSEKTYHRLALRGDLTSNFDLVIQGLLDRVEEIEGKKKK